MTELAAPLQTTKFYDPVEINFSPGDRTFVAWISTETVDHEGDVVVAKGVDFTSVFFPANPVVMAFHDYGRWPIGQAKWVKSKTTKGFAGIYAMTEVDEDPDSEIVWQKIKSKPDGSRGSVRGISIGFKPPVDFQKGDWGPPTAEELKANPHWKGATRIIRRCLLFEYSVVPIPMNPDALITVVAKGIHRPKAHALETPMDETTAEEFQESHPLIAKKIDELCEMKRFSSGVKDATALGPLRETLVGAVAERLCDRMRGFLWSVAYDSEASSSDTVAILTQACSEFQNAMATAILAFDPMKAKKGIGSVIDSSRWLTKPLHRSNEAKTLFGNPFDGIDDLLTKAAKEMDDEDTEEEAETETIKKGDFVKCMKGEYKGCVGKCMSIHKGEMVPDVEDDVPSKASDPAARVRVHKAMAGGHVETEHHIGCKCSDLEKIADLKKPPKTKKGIDPLTLPPLSGGKTDAEVQAEQLQKLRRTLTPEFVKAQLIREQERALGVV